MDESAGRGPHLGELREALSLAAGEALRFLETLPEQPVRPKGADEAAMRFGGPLPEKGDGATAAIRTLLDDGMDAVIRSAGPRFFHFVIGGSTPAALAADWLASAFDQNNGAWLATPLAARLEAVSLSWLKELFRVPASWGGVLTTGATMANFVGLACARRWWAERHGVDVDEQGLSGLPEVPVFSSGYIHPSATKALAMLGLGRSRVRRFSADDGGRLDLEALERALRDLRGAPAILVANAGEVNAGDFDPIARVADLADQHGAWLHVDGAFGLFAAVSPRTSHLVEGIERAHSVIADGHKWLNVPYDCGFAFVRDPALLAPVFSFAAAYLPRVDDPRPNFMILGPEASRRARSLPVWATLHAYGRAGVREIVERHLLLAQRVARRVDEAADLERLAEVPLNIVCFRYRPEGVPAEHLDDLNRRLGEAVLADGRVYVGTTVYRGRVAFRPAIVNWMTGEGDVDLLVDVIRELGARLLEG
ncbi:MAG: pyridoxal phosphate-dependent decarboxylase family protein [Actinomycetota bacterium]